MSQSTFATLSVVLGIVSTFAFQTGHYLVGAITMIVHGGLTIYMATTNGKRLMGGLMIGFGLYILALILGLLTLGLIRMLC